jgi:hypothetical protein
MNSFEQESDRENEQESDRENEQESDRENEQESEQESDQGNDPESSWKYIREFKREQKLSKWDAATKKTLNQHIKTFPDETLMPLYNFWITQVADLVTPFGVNFESKPTSDFDRSLNFEQFCKTIMYIDHVDTGYRAEDNSYSYKHKVERCIDEIESIKDRYVSNGCCILALLARKIITLNDCQNAIAEHSPNVIIPERKPEYSILTQHLIDKIETKIKGYLSEEKKIQKGISFNFFDIITPFNELSKKKQETIKKLQSLRSVNCANTMLADIIENIENGWKSSLHSFYDYPYHSNSTKKHLKWLSKYGEMERTLEEWRNKYKNIDLSGIADDENRTQIVDGRYQYTKIISNILRLWKKKHNLSSKKDKKLIKESRHRISLFLF